MPTTFPETRALLVGFSRTGAEGAQLAAFDMYDAALRERLNLHVTRHDGASFDEVERVVSDHACDVAFLTVDWRWPGFKEGAHVELFRRLHDRPNRPRLIFIDYSAQTSSGFFDLLPHVDAFGKRQVLRDRDAYQTEYRGGFVFADWYSRTYGFDLTWWRSGKIPDPAYIDRVQPIWNLSVTPAIRNLLRREAMPWRFLRRKTIDLHSRVIASKPDHWQWYHDYRQKAQEAVEPLRERMTVTPRGKVGPRRYFHELRRSKLVFSPFGWGEVCFRDYEAAACGAALVKPSMAHLETEPHLFDPGETYAPVRWDNSDLAEVCLDLHANPVKARRLAANAKAALKDYLDHARFVDVIRKLLESAKAPRP